MQNYSQKEDNVTAGDTVDNTEGKEIREDASKPQKRGSVYISEELQGTRTESMKLTERDFVSRISKENGGINDDAAMAEERSDLTQSNPRVVADGQEGREPQLETQAKPTADGGSMDLQGTPENRPCSSFRLDMSATHFNTCKCGFAKQDHDSEKSPSKSSPSSGLTMATSSWHCSVCKRVNVNTAKACAVCFSPRNYQRGQSSSSNFGGDE